MTEETTGGELTPEQIAAQAEQKKTNQEEATKRLVEKNEKLEEKVKAFEEKEKAASTEETTLDPTKPEDLRKIIKEEMSAESTTEAGVAKALAEFPELKEHEAKIREYLADSTRKDIPIEEVIAGAVGAKALMKMGAGMDAARLQTAEETAAGGGGAQIETKTEAEKNEAKWHNSLPEQFK